MESLRAAVINGANAVYLGGASFNARAKANNFDKYKRILPKSKDFNEDLKRKGEK